MRNAAILVGVATGVGVAYLVHAPMLMPVLLVAAVMFMETLTGSQT